MYTTKKLLEDCKELSKTYSDKIQDYTTRSRWIENQEPADLDQDTLDFIENDIKTTREELSSKLLILEMRINKD